MHFKLLAVAGAAALLLATPARVDASCCDQGTKNTPCCEHKADMACCEHHGDTVKDGDAISMLMSFARPNPQLEPAPPVRQATEVWFMRPVMVGKSILQGHYVIEHDTDRMARGEPCTHIYAFDDRQKPVVAFHCTHLERDRTSKPIAVVERRGDWEYLTEFQFAGETASHGVPIR
jgi:hypothetical protein